MKAWVATQNSWLVAERLAAYAHDLNPIEMGWGNVKAGVLANLCPNTIDEARSAAESEPGRVAGVADRDRAADQLGDLDAASAEIADPAPLHGSLDGSGAAAAPRGCADCTPLARWLHPVPDARCNGCTPSALSTAPAGCGDCTP